MNIFGQELSKDELIQRIGHISQLAGTKRYTLREGKGEGVDAIDFKTGSGLGFTVVPSRAMDIAWLEYKGMPVAQIAKGGMSNPQFHSPAGYEWLRNFFSGMLTTCGLTHVGPPEKEGIWDIGLHGRISNLPAEEVIAKNYWRGQELVMEAEGKVREAVIFGENLTLTRKIETLLGANKLFIHDQIVNEGYKETPFMILYHMNMGYPIVSEHSSLYAPIIHTQARDEEAQNGIDEYHQFQIPTPEYEEQVFFHQLAADAEGRTWVAIINDKINFGAYISFNKGELPYFTQWKMMGQQDYVVGLEPGNCVPEGRAAARKKDRLVMLQPGARKDISIEIGILDGEVQINEFKEKIQGLCV